MASALTSSTSSASLRTLLSAKVVKLYRQICREVPRIFIMYGVEGYSHADARRLILLNQFRKNGSVSDPRLIEMLLDHARMEIEETLQQWKQKPHIMALLEPEIEAADPWGPEEFRRLFESGNSTLDEVVWADHDPVAHKKRLGKLAARIQREAPEEWARIRQAESLIEKLELR